jgi:hypothetical protein
MARRLPKNAYERELLKQLQEMAAANPVRDGYAYANVADYVLRHGVWYRPAPLPEDVEEGTAGKCFYHAYALADRGYHYVEGFAYSLYLGTLHHAWVAKDRKRSAIDPTWSNGKAYLGIRLNASLREWEQSNRYYWPVIGNVDEGFPLLKKRRK